MNGTYGYANVRRWSRKFDVFEKEKIFIPVNISNSHWTMIVVFVQKREIHYYDSMNNSGARFTKAVLQVLPTSYFFLLQVDLSFTSLLDIESKNFYIFN